MNTNDPSRFVAQLVYEYLTSAGFDVIAYSGRGMFGRKCLAVVTADPLNVIPGALVAALDADASKEELATFADAVNGAKQDSMGRDAVIYWEDLSAEGVQFEDHEDEEHEEADELPLAARKMWA